MNKIQIINLLELRGITEANGVSVGELLAKSGGTPTDQEMAKVNEASMHYFYEKYQDEVSKNEELTKEVQALRKTDAWLRCLEAAGVDNWSGYDLAIEIRDGGEY
jgi:hypothetical protein